MSGPATDGVNADAYAELLDAVAAGPRAWEFLALVRGVEQARSDLPRVGTALDPTREAIELTHLPSADFPRTTVAEFLPDRRRPTVRSTFMGLTGPMGPLPLHLTEIAIYERSGRAPSPFADFLDLLSARMLQAFYRAWAQANPAAQADRPHDDGFGGMVGAATGAASLRFVTAAERPQPSANEFDDWRRLAYAAHLAGSRSAGAVADLLTHLLERPVRVVEHVARRRPVPAAARTRIGGRRGAHAAVGRGATLGGSFLAVEWDVAIEVRARSMDDLARFLPGGEMHRLLGQAVRAALPAHLDWEARVTIDEAAVEPARLGGTRLGQTGWMAPRRRGGVTRTDVRLRPSGREAPVAA